MCVMQNGKSGRFFLFHNKMMKIKQTKIVEGETPMEMLLTVWLCDINTPLVNCDYFLFHRPMSLCFHIDSKHIVHVVQVNAFSLISIERLMCCIKWIIHVLFYFSLATRSVFASSTFCLFLEPHPHSYGLFPEASTMKRAQHAPGIFPLSGLRISVTWRWLSTL